MMLRALGLLLLISPLSACLAAAAVGAAVDVTGDVVVGAVKVTGAAADAVLPGDDDDEDEDDD